MEYANVCGTCQAERQTPVVTIGDEDYAICAECVRRFVDAHTFDARESDTHIRAAPRLRDVSKK